ncbi:MAG: type I pantothenate kinase [Trueperella sp.]|nr:type I pantothenate kinase [Trueperella sp.]
MHSEHGPFLKFTHEQWESLASSTALPLTESDIARLISLGDPIGLAEVDAIYRPLSALMQMYARNTGDLFAESKEFLGYQELRTPWIVGIAGSVSVGKSTTARLLQELLRRWPLTPHVDLVPTDGFLYPNSVLEERGILDRKGFPESYDRHALLNFLSAVKAGEPNLKVPVYDHVSYDIVPGEFITVDQPEILILEGLNVLQPARPSTDSNYTAISDFFDFSIYLDAPVDALEEWFVARFLALRGTAFSDERSYFRSFAELNDTEAEAMAREVWHTINLPNLMENILPTRSRATVILSKGPTHRIEEVALRRL